MNKSTKNQNTALTISLTPPSPHSKVRNQESKMRNPAFQGLSRVLKGFQELIFAPSIDSVLSVTSCSSAFQLFQHLPLLVSGVPLSVVSGSLFSISTFELSYRNAETPPTEAPSHHPSR